MGSSRNINQERAIKHYLKMNPDLVPQMGVAGISIGFKNKVTGETFDKTITHMEHNYNHHLRAEEERRKKMKKELKTNGHPIKSKPRTIRTPRGGTQISLTGDDSPEGDA